ncbi:hypothetical protein GCM10023080_040900 [Streptomyces pseudoechinosporeus]
MGLSRRLFGAGAPLAAFVLLVGCGSNDEGSGDEPVNAASLCEGNLSTKARGAMELIAGTKEFLPLDSSSAKRAAEDIVDDYLLGSLNKERDVCRIHAPGTTEIAEITVQFSLDDGRFLSGSGDDPSFKAYGIGRKALASPNKAVLYVECSSAKLSDTSATLLRGELLNRDSPEGDAEDLRRANLTVLHSVALALTKELGCADNAGLSTEPSFT